MHQVATAGFLDVEKHPDSDQMGIIGYPSPLTLPKFRQSVVCLCLFVCNNRLKLVSCSDEALAHFLEVVQVNLWPDLRNFSLLPPHMHLPLPSSMQDYLFFTIFHHAILEFFPCHWFCRFSNTRLPIISLSQSLIIDHLIPCLANCHYPVFPSFTFD